MVTEQRVEQQIVLRVGGVVVIVVTAATGLTQVRHLLLQQEVQEDQAADLVGREQVQL